MCFIYYSLFITAYHVWTRRNHYHVRQKLPLWKCLLITSLSLRTQITSKPVNLYVLLKPPHGLVYAFDFSIKGSEEAGPAAAGPQSSPALTVVLSSQASCPYIWPSPLPFELGKLCAFCFVHFTRDLWFGSTSSASFPLFFCCLPVT